MLTDPLPAAPLWLANLQLDLIERLLVRADLPAMVIVSGLLSISVGRWPERVELDGWAAEVIRTG